MYSARLLTVVFHNLIIYSKLLLCRTQCSPWFAAAAVHEGIYLCASSTMDATLHLSLICMNDAGGISRGQTGGNEYSVHRHGCMTAVLYFSAPLLRHLCFNFNFYRYREKGLAAPFPSSTFQSNFVPS